MSEAETKTVVEGEAPTAEELKAQKRSAEVSLWFKYFYDCLMQGLNGEFYPIIYCFEP